MFDQGLPHLPDAVAALQRVLVALAIGFLIGLERERAEVRKEHKIFAGVRTFPLIALLGALGVILQPAVGASLLAVGFVGVGAVAFVSYVRASGAGDVGATTEVAALGTYVIGAAAGAGLLVVAGATGVTVAVLLVAKPRLEAFSRALTEKEIAAALELAVVSAIVLPLLPDRAYGPFDAFNPFEAWLMVVLVSGVSFAGFVGMRVWGQERGLTAAALVGALVSSTAVTLAMAERSRQTPALARTAAAATVLASTVMCLRVTVLVGVVAPGLVPSLVPITGVMAAAGACAGLWLIRRAPVDAVAAAADAARDPAMESPFRFKPALVFGALFVMVKLGVKAGTALFGSAGVVVVAGFSGLIDVDAITLAVARNGRGATHLAAQAVAVMAVAVALVSNTLVKLGIAVGAGGRSFRRLAALALGGVVLAGVVTALAVLLNGMS